MIESRRRDRGSSTGAARWRRPARIIDFPCPRPAPLSPRCKVAACYQPADNDRRPRSAARARPSLGRPAWRGEARRCGERGRTGCGKGDLAVWGGGNGGRIASSSSFSSFFCPWCCSLVTLCLAAALVLLLSRAAGRPAPPTAVLVSIMSRDGEGPWCRRPSC